MRFLVELLIIYPMKIALILLAIGAIIFYLVLVLIAALMDLMWVLADIILK